MRFLRIVGIGSLFVALTLFIGCKKGIKPEETVSAPEASPAIVLKQPTKKPNVKYYPEGTPTRAIQDLDDQLDSYILSPQTTEERQYNEALKKEILKGTFDIRELCRLSLADHWKDRSSSEQDYFVGLMTSLLEKKAVFSKEQGGKQRSGTKYAIRYEGHRFLNPEKGQAFVKTLIQIPSEDLRIELNYKVLHAGEIWKIYDVIVDGASLLDNYRFQFDKIIKKDGYPTLVHRMESKLKELETQPV